MPAALRGLKFASVGITVQEGGIVPVEREGKQRLNRRFVDLDNGDNT